MSVPPVFRLPAEKFPIAIEAFSEVTGEVVWQHTVERPTDVGVVIIPGDLRQRAGGPVGIRIRYGDGVLEEQKWSDDGSGTVGQSAAIT